MEPFTQYEDEQLIYMVKKHPLLYDVSHDSYKDQHKREEVWIKIAKEVGKSVTVCKKHWRSLRDGYARFRRNLKTGYNYAHTRHKVKWHIYDQLTFLDSELGGAVLNSDSNFEGENESDEEDTPAPKDTPWTPKDTKVSKSSKKESQNLTKSFKRARKFVKQDEFVYYMKRVEKSYESFTKAILKKQDRQHGLCSFAEHIQSVMKEFPPLLQVRAKQEMFRILSKYELAAIDNDISILDGPSEETHCESIVKIERIQ